MKKVHILATEMNVWDFKKPIKTTEVTLMALGRDFILRNETFVLLAVMNQCQQRVQATIF